MLSRSDIVATVIIVFITLSQLAFAKASNDGDTETVQCLIEPRLPKSYFYSLEQQESYLLGNAFIKQLIRKKVDVDSFHYLRGMIDFAEGKPPFEKEREEDEKHIRALLAFPRSDEGAFRSDVFKIKNISGCSVEVLGYGIDNDFPEDTFKRASYYLGYYSLKNFSNERGVGSFKINALVWGARFAFWDQEIIYSDEEVLEITQQIEKSRKQKYESHKKKLSRDNLEKGKEFVRSQLSRSDVTIMPSGLVYQVLNKGTGLKPKLTDVVRVHYQGQRLDGTIFDSSVQRGEPIEIRPNQVISGWTEALQLMSVGSKWKITIPPSLAYGEEGSAAGIGPNETLVFTIELLAIQ